MKRLSSAFAGLLLVGVVTSSQANAGFGLAGSLGAGVFVKDDTANRTSFNLEIIPFYKIGIVSLDLGIVVDFEEMRQQGRHFSFRPGVRVDFFALYARAAIPLRVNEGGDLGVLLGLGVRIPAGPIGVFLEADVNFSRELGFSVVPLEVRAGVQFSF